MRPFLLLCFFLSGFSALVYENAWTRWLTLFLGNSTEAVSIIIAGFMAGMALGSLALGRIADSVRNPLFLFGILELGIGVGAFFFQGVLHWGNGSFLFIGESLGAGAGKYAASFCLLLPATFFMGATFPVLGRTFITSGEGVGWNIGLLYGVNTFGASAGACATGFFLIERFGVWKTSSFAASLNLFVGGALILLFLAKGSSFQRKGESLQEREVREKTRRGTFTFRNFCVMAIFLLWGMIFLSSEVLWTRGLAFFLEGFSYSFSALLTVFLLGLVLGSFFFSSLADQTGGSQRLLPLLLLAASFSSLLTLWGFERGYSLNKFLGEILGRGSPWAYKGGLLLFSFLLLFLPTFFAGGLFPVVGRILTRDQEMAGRSLAKLYALSSLGSALGPILTGFFLMDILRLKEALFFLSAAVMLLAIAAAFLGRGISPFRKGAVLLGGGAVLAAFWAFFPLRTPFIMNSHIFQGARGEEHILVEALEGRAGSAAVIQNVKDGSLSLYTDDFLAAATGRLYTYMKMLGHLPLFLAPKPEKVLVICFGTGTSCGAVASHEEVKEIHGVEISREVVVLARHFREANRAVLEDPRLRMHIGDGRAFVLQAGTGRYDVITLEPLMPYTPAAVYFYTEEFYRLCRERLGRGGVMCQWIPLHALSNEDFRSLVRTFARVFPGSSLWFFEQSALVAGMKEGKPSLSLLLEKWLKKGDLLRELGMESPERFLSALMMEGEGIERACAAAPLMKDDLPFLEFHPLSRGSHTTFLADNLAFLANSRMAPEETSLALEAPGEEFLQGWKGSWETSGLLLQGRYWFALYHYYFAFQRRGEAEEALERAFQSFREACQRDREGSTGVVLLKDVTYSVELESGWKSFLQGKNGEALEAFRRAASIFPDREEAYYYAGLALEKEGNFSEAFSEFAAAARIYPGFKEALAHMGRAYWNLGDKGEAALCFQRAGGWRSISEYSEDLAAVARRAEKERALGTFGTGEGFLLETYLDTLHREVIRAGSGDFRRGLAAGAERRRAVRKAVGIAVLKRGTYEEWASREGETFSLAGEREEERGGFALDIFFLAGDWRRVAAALKSPLSSLRARGASYLGESGTRGCIPSLIGLLRDKAEEVRLSAWVSLWKLTRKQFGFEHNASPRLREEAVKNWEAWWEAEGKSLQWNREKGVFE